MSKMKDLTKAELKEVAGQAEQMFEAIEGFRGIIFKFAMAMDQVEQKVKELVRSTTLTDWRSQAVFELIQTGPGPFSKEVLNAKMREIQIRDFDVISGQADLDEGFIVVETPAEDGLTAILSVDLYQDGVELPENGVVRSRIEIGKGQSTFLPKLIDEVLVGMSSGETVSLTVESKDGEVTAGLTLLGLRKKLPKAPPQVSDGGAPSNVASFKAPADVSGQA